MNGIPQKEEREAIRREWEERLSGASNAGKFLMTFNEDPARTPDIQAFPLSDADKQYQFLSEETAKQIMVGHRVVSPLIHGIRESNGFGSNKDEMLVGLEIFNNQVIKPYQRIITNTFAPILGSDLKIEMNNVFDDVTVVVEPTTQSIELKKKVVAAENKISAEDSALWLAHLREKAEYIDEEEWQLISDEEVTNPEEEEKYRTEFMSVRGYSNPDKKSDALDTGLYKVRYYYSKNFTYKDGEIVTRDFCQEMVALSKMGALFRYEDIIKMGDDGVNSEFAASGSSTLNIWIYKGGVYCRHAWFRKVFMRKRQGGKFLPNDGLNNDKVVTGAIANELFPKGEESIRPNDMPNRASLKYK